MYPQEAKKLKLNINKSPNSKDSIVTTITDKPEELDSLKTDKTPAQTKSKSSLDTVVVYSAKDTAVFNIKSKNMRLRGNSKLAFKRQNLESEIIEMDFNANDLKAEGVRDSNNKLVGYPKFNDKGEVFYCEKLAFNFKTKQGVIKMGETEMGEGFYFGDKIKRKNEQENFIQDGKYTTCEEPHPHYYFGSPQMKLVEQDKIFIDPAIFYLEDMPIFILPFGLFFSSQSGRRSGLIIPSFFFSSSRGVTLENFGIYFALSDYYDTRLGVDFYSKGGYNLKSFTQWKYQDAMSGNMDIQFGRTRYNPNDNYSSNWMFRANHNQQINPQENISVNLSFSSQDFNRNTQWNQTQRLQQEISSNASYSRSYDNGSSLSMSYVRSQNIITNTYTQSPSVNFSLPQLYPFKKLVSSENFLKDIYISYSGSAYLSNSKSINIGTKKIGDTTVADTSFLYRTSTVISHSPRIALILPKISYFTFSPYLSFSANNYFRRVSKRFDNTDSTVKDSYEYGLYSEFNYNLGISMSTRIYGIAKPKIFGINAIRHTIQPNLSLSVTPDLSSDKLGFFGSYYDAKQKQTIKYSRFEADGSGIASRAFSSSLGYSVVNNIAVKMAQGDTIEDKTIDLTSFTFSGNYDFAKKEQKFSDIGMSFHTANIGSLSLNGSAGFTLYDEARLWDSVNNKYNTTYSRINKFLISSGQGLARLTNFSLNLSTSFSSDASPEGSSGKSKQGKDSIGLGERFSNRINYQEEEFDFFGENKPGYKQLTLPWNMSFNINYSYGSYTKDVTTQSFTLGANFSLTITPSWSANGFLQYDLIKKELMSPVINLHKDMHCWEFNFTWYPVGYNRGFYMRFGIKAPQLKDLKYEERSSQYF